MLLRFCLINGDTFETLEIKCGKQACLPIFWNKNASYTFCIVYFSTFIREWSRLLCKRVYLDKVISKLSYS